MLCSWNMGALKMLGKRDRFTWEMVINESSEIMRDKILCDIDLDRKLEGGEGERPIFATRVCNKRYTLYWEFNKNKLAACVLAFIPAGGESYFKSANILEDFINFFKQTNSFSMACNEVVKKNKGESVFNHW